MDESTTTNEPTDDGVQSTQPPAVDTHAAENQPAEPTTTTDNQEAESSQPADENLAWLQNKGIDPQSPEALAKVAEMYRNAEKAMHQSTQEKAQLQNALQTPTDTATDNFITDPVDALQAQVQALTIKSTVSDFFSAHPDAKEYESKMAEIVSTNPNIGELVKGQYISVEQLYQMAKGADPSREQSLKTEGGREALQSVADKQQAKAITGNATNSAMSTSGPTKENFDSWYAGLSASERAKPETQQIVASLLS